LSDELTGVKNSMKRKLDLIKFALDNELRVDILTVMIPENIRYFEEYVCFVKDIPNLTWTPLRAESNEIIRHPITKNQIQILAEEISELMNIYPDEVPKLGLATPFCAVKPIELGKKVFCGRKEVCGPYKSLTVDVFNNMFACYSCRNNYGPVKSIYELDLYYEHKILTDISYLPDRCQMCIYVDICCGGCKSPYALKVFENKYIDYLAFAE
jgi:radical SAM protein with 4Fe4S-binding SPASM domain